MALYWDWNKKCGELIVQDLNSNKEFTKNLYEGNAFLIVLSEWKENDTDMYSLYTFFADETHAKNCLGLTKNHTNIFDDGWHKIIKLRLNKKKSNNWKKIVKLFMEAFDNIDIELYSEE